VQDRRSLWFAARLYPLRGHLGQFDFSAQPSLDHRLAEDLATLRFVEEKANVLLIGPPGVGKTMLATALGHKAVEAAAPSAAGTSSATPVRGLGTTSRIDYGLLESLAVKVPTRTSSQGLCMPSAGWGLPRC
jgi:DNA replication protein DnaC